MQNDERDERRDPEEPVEPQEPEPSADEAAGQDEFEAGWPQQDSTSQQEREEQEREEREAEPNAPVESEPTADAGWTLEERREEAETSQPPPPEVEAYPPGPAAPDDHPSDAVAAHSVPATEPGESTRCPRCGTENRPGISFCRNCGQRLVAAGAPAAVERPAPPEGTQACPRCGTHNRSGVAFCQNCGANLLGAGEGYVPPVVQEAPAAAAVAEADEAGRALLGPIVLLIGAIGIVSAWLLPFAIGDVSLFDQSFGRNDGYGVAFWGSIGDLDAVADQAYFGLAAAAPLLALLLAGLAVGGVVRRTPGVLQMIGLAIALLWAIGLVVLFGVVEVFGGPGGELLDVLRNLSPAGIIFMLASLIVVIGVLTRFGRS